MFVGLLPCFHLIDPSNPEGQLHLRQDLVDSQLVRAYRHHNADDRWSRDLCRRAQVGHDRPEILSGLRQPRPLGRKGQRVRDHVRNRARRKSARPDEARVHRDPRLGLVVRSLLSFLRHRFTPSRCHPFRVWTSCVGANRSAFEPSPDTSDTSSCAPCFYPLLSRASPFPRPAEPWRLSPPDDASPVSISATIASIPAAAAGCSLTHFPSCKRALNRL